MKNWRYFLAAGAMSAACCGGLDFATTVENGFPAVFAVSIAQDDPFGDDADAFDDGSDSFGSTGDETVEAGSESATDDAPNSADPFGADEESDGPFAPSALEPKAPSANEESEAAGAKENPLVGKRARTGEEALAKYKTAVDVPDEEKTEADFLKTLTAAEKTILGKDATKRDALGNVSTDPPTNAEDLLVAAIRISRVGRPAFAKLLIQKAVDAPLGTPEECAKALDSLGPVGGAGGAFGFVANPTFGEAGTTVVEKVVDAAKEYWEGDAAIRDAIARIGRGTSQDRAKASVDLRKGGAKAVAILVSDLAGTDAAARETAKTLLGYFETEGVDALLAAVRDADETGLAAVVDELGAKVDGRIGLELAARYWRGVDDASAKSALESALKKQYGDVPTRTETVAAAFAKAREFFKKTVVFPNVVDGEATFWGWDAAAKAPAPKSVEVAAASRTFAAYWAQTALKIAAADATSALLDLTVVATAERALYEAGLDSPDAAVVAFEAELPNLTVPQLLAAVDYALQTKRFNGAIVPTILLRGRGDASLCVATPNSGEPSTVVRAATCENRRLRFEALRAIVDWNPNAPFFGSARVAAALEWFATANGERIAIVASPKLDDAGKIGRTLAEQGFKVVPVSTGRDALLRAQGSADVELVVAATTTSAPDLRVVAQMLRSDVRTIDVPLLVGYADEFERDAAGKLVGVEPNAAIAPTPFDLESSSFAVQNVFDVVKPEQVPADLRLADAKEAAAAIVRLISTRPGVFEFADENALLARFLATPALFDSGLELASTLKTPFAQTALVGLIGDLRYDAATRRRALDAIKRQWAANGSLLRGPEINAMYDRYNASEKEDAETQKILSDLLDAFETATEK